MRKLLLGLLVIVVLGMIAVAGINQIDEDLSPAVVEWRQPPPIKLAAADNAFLFQLGFQAAAEQDPRAAAEAQLADYEKRLRDGPINDIGPTQALKFRGESTSICRAREETCLTPGRLDAAALQRAADANSVLLARYRQLIRLPHFEEAMTPSPMAPLLPAGALVLVRGLHYNQLLLQAQAGAVAKSVQALAADARYWRMVLAESRSLLAKMLAAASLGENWAILAEILAMPAFDGSRDAAVAASMSIPLTADERDLGRALKLEFQALTYALAHPSGGLFGVAPELPSWLEGFVQKALYLPNATQNAHQAILAKQVALSQLPAPELLVAIAAEDKSLEDIDVGPSWHWIRNPVGKLFLQIGSPRFHPYALRLHDLEGFRRLLQVQLQARGRGTQPPGVPQLLADLGSAVTDPYTGKPMLWDAPTRKLSFQPRSSNVLGKSWSVAL